MTDQHQTESEPQTEQMAAEQHTEAPNEAPQVDEASAAPRAPDAVRSILPHLEGKEIDEDAELNAEEGEEQGDYRRGPVVRHAGQIAGHA